MFRLRATVVDLATLRDPGAGSRHNQDAPPLWVERIMHEAEEMASAELRVLERIMHEAVCALKALGQLRETLRDNAPPVHVRLQSDTFARQSDRLLRLQRPLYGCCSEACADIVWTCVIELWCRVSVELRPGFSATADVIMGRLAPRVRAQREQGSHASCGCETTPDPSCRRG